MAIVKVTGGGSGLEPRVGLKAAKKAAKKGAGHAIEKQAAKKSPGKKSAKKAAKKQAAKHAGKKAATSSLTIPGTKQDRSAANDERARHSELLSRAFHHLHRAGSLISLLEPQSGGDLKQLLEYGTEIYRAAAETGGQNDSRDVVLCALGLLRAAEHLAMAGLYSARTAFRVRISPPDAEEVGRHLVALGPRLERLAAPISGQQQRLQAMAKELLRRAQQSDRSDPHLDFELVMAADGLCTALEEGL